jgi:alpha-glucosidase
LNADSASRNVATLAADPHSTLALYGHLLALRRERAALHSGTYVQTHTEGDIIAFERRHHQDQRLLVVLNLGGSPDHFTLPDDAREARLLLSTALDREGEAVHSVLDLRQAEGVILELLRPN